MDVGLCVCDMAPAEIDLAVVSGGMAGLTAAARAGHDGANVLLVEPASELGGSARYAGYLWTAPTDEVLADVDPDAVDWMPTLGVRSCSARPSRGFGWTRAA